MIPGIQIDIQTNARLVLLHELG